MTNKELREKLAAFPDDMEVLTGTEQGFAPVVEVSLFEEDEDGYHYKVNSANVRLAPMTDKKFIGLDF